MGCDDYVTWYLWLSFYLVIVELLLLDHPSGHSLVKSPQALKRGCCFRESDEAERHAAGNRVTRLQGVRVSLGP